MSKKLIFLWLAVFITLNVSAQKASTQFESTYKATKELLDQGKFGLAVQSFKSLLAKEEKNDLVPYARFYLGNAAYFDGDKSYAKNVFLELTLKHPNWSKKDAAYLWLSRIGFEQSGVFKGMLYTNEIQSEPYLSKSNAFVKTQVLGQPLDIIAQLHNEYPISREIAKEYLLALNNLPYSEQPTSKMDSLIETFNFDRAQFNTLPPSIIKEHYTIGILLPLYIDRMEATGKYLKKSLAVDIYEGSKMAAFDVDSTMFTLAVYDTKKDSAQIGLYERNGVFIGLDAVLGPIYSKPTEKMKEVSVKEKLNILNPTSSNSAICLNNPYAFLSRASAKQLGQEAAKYMRKESTLKNVYIYYGTSEVDSILAFTYKNELEKDSFRIKAMTKIGVDNRRDVYDGLTASKTIIDRSKTYKMTKEQIKNAFSLPKIDSLLIPADSIGHIFIASSDPTISTEAMSAIISRGDSVKIMGAGNWFESNNAGLGIMEGLGVTLVISAVDDVSTAEYKDLTNRYIKLYSARPSKYFFRGYFGMKAIASSLKKYGTYFQNGYHQQGNFNEMFDFEQSNSNASIKIIKLEDNKIVTLNLDEENK